MTDAWETIYCLPPGDKCPILRGEFRTEAGDSIKVAVMSRGNVMVMDAADLRPACLAARKLFMSEETNGRVWA